MPYYKDINTLFIHIPKTGGTKLESYLKNKYTQQLYSYITQIDKFNVITNGCGNTILPEPNLRNLSLQHQTYRTIFKYRELLNLDFNNIKIITIVRNPYNRIISDLIYCNLIDDKTNIDKIPNVINKYLHQNNRDNHNIPQHQFLIDDNNNLITNITIFNTENLTKQLKNYGFSDYDFIPKEKNYMKFLNKKSIQLINTFYKKDFELFGYNMIN